MKTLALVSILKNERHNLERFLSSFKGCIDHAYLCDTGSTDGSVEWIKENAERVIGCPVTLSHFIWIDDFAAARNFAGKDVKEDYWMWADLDDVLAEQKFFLEWKKSAMKLADVWFVPYYYGFNAEGVPVCKFVRERVFKTKKDFKFASFVHEGVRIPDGCLGQPITSWQIHHKRTIEEHEKDRSRNLDLLISRYNQLDPRLHVYLGKEFFDNGKYKEAAETLEQALKYPGSVLDIGDRIMAVQYLSFAYANLENMEMAMKTATVGTQLDPMRAEFYCMIGNAYFSKNMLHEAIPWYRAATGCFNQSLTGMTKLFTQDEMYGDYPRTKLAQIYFNLGLYEFAEREVEGVQTVEAKEVLERIQLIKDSTPSPTNVIDCDDIVFTCLHSAYPWDDKVYKEKGIGGSETACVEMASWLAKITSRPVKVFQEREEPFVSENGVTYIPLKSMVTYFSKWRPKVHIAWRHNQKLTDATTYLWCHDLYTPGGEQAQNYLKMICLSPFHKSYVQALQGVADEKIWISRNGLRGGRFENLDATKKSYGKVIWPNSPDRGLDYAILVMDEVRKEIPGAELHVFYGMENLEKYGHGELRKKLDGLMSSRPWVKYHGNVDQATLAKHMAESEVWLYTANFIESFCITALEALACRCWPVVRDMGALPDTLSEAKRLGMAQVLDIDTTPSDIKAWSRHVIEAIDLRKWQDIHYDINKHSWESVAQDWVKEMDL